MAKDEVAIRIEGVYKDFSFTSARSNTLKSVFTSLYKSKNKDIKTQHALKDINLEIKKGEFFGIVGRNGSGKSTLLKIIAGIYQPSKGHIAVNGKLVPFIELGVGFNPELTGKENVYLNGAMLGFSDKEVDKFYDEVVEFAELEKFMDKKLKNYSSGMQVRLAFSMAIRAKADILLVDEVLAVGDADFQRKCFNFFKYLKREQKTVIFVSHDMSAIREYCDKVALINKNKIVDMGIADNIATKYTKLFLEHGENTDQVVDNNRWGDGTIKTSKLSIKTSLEVVTIEQTIKAIQTAENYILGIRIKDATGQHVLGTNTKLEQIKTGKIKKSQSVHFVWCFPNILNDGRYGVDISIHKEDGVAVTDWWDDACSFSIIKEKRVPYTIDPGFIIRKIS